MATLSIWNNQSNKVQVVQLSDDPADGTDAEQIEYLKTTDAYKGLTCLSENYQGAFPDSDSSSWVWDGEKVITEPETPEQILAKLEGALDRHLDSVANDYRYESIRTMVTYATSVHPKFGAEGKAAVKFRDAVYAHGIKALQDVQAGLRPIPTEAELIAELPPFADFLE
jgi:hypothetical protein